VLEAADGGAAVDIAERHSGTIDLLLSDVVMPVFGGPEVARRVVGRRPETRVLFISGYAPETLGDLRVPGTESRLLPKPFTMDTLVTRVRALLRGQGPQEAGAPAADWMDGAAAR
jgi:two-component system cell cycle sensor histidine kinase/response regulator CckA